MILPRLPVATSPGSLCSHPSIHNYNGKETISCFFESFSSAPPVSR